MISIITRDRSHAHTRQRSVGAAVWRKNGQHKVGREKVKLRCKTNTPKVQKIKNIYVCCLHYGSANVKYMLLA